MLRVFVYGTLKPGEVNYDRFCAGKVLDQQPAIVRGRLYDFSQLGYPALTVGDRPVQGFVLTFSHGAILTVLDELEDYDPKRLPHENEYIRQKIEVTSPAGQPQGWAWVYRMTPLQVKRLGGILLPEGRWTGR